MVLALAIMERLFAHHAAEARLAGMTAHRLRDALGGDTPQIAEVRLADGRGGTLTFTNMLDGLWRSPSVLGAPAAVSQLERFVDTVLDCECYVRSIRPEHAARYGLEGESALRVSFHGPGTAGRAGPKLLLEAEIGHCLPEAGQCFVRPAGQSSVWAMECDLRSLLSAGQRGTLPPLVDPHLIPAVWPGRQSTLRRVVITRTGQGAIELQRHDREAPPQVPGRDGPSWTWVLLHSAGGHLPVHQGLANSFTSFVLSVPFEGISSPEDAVALDWKNPRARVALFPDAGEPLELRVGEPQAWGTPVYNSFARLVYILSPEAAGLLAPSAARLASDSAGDPWIALLERTSRETPVPGMPSAEEP